MAVSIGSDDPGANFMVADAQLEATLVGTDADGDFTDRLTFRNLFDALATQVTLGDDGNPVATAPPGLISLLGRYEPGGRHRPGGRGAGPSRRQTQARCRSRTPSAPTVSRSSC